VTLLFVIRIAAALVSIPVAAILSAKLIEFPDAFTRIERYGMGLFGSALILRIAPLLSSPEPTPFDHWSALMLGIGAFMMSFGRWQRLRRHKRANTLAHDAAVEHLRRRGKL
jgi:hypothetical protein